MFLFENEICHLHLTYVRCANSFFCTDSFPARHPPSSLLLMPTAALTSVRPRQMKPPTSPVRFQSPPSHFGDSLSPFFETCIGFCPRLPLAHSMFPQSHQRSCFLAISRTGPGIFARLPVAPRDAFLLSLVIFQGLCSPSYNHLLFTTF